MAIRVEFFGIARQRAGKSEILVPVAGKATSLGQVLERLARDMPQLQAFVVGERLDSSLSANLDGERFISDPATPIQDGQCLLVLSADAGG